MRHAPYLLLALLLALVGCSRAPVRGTVEDSAESFKGSATGWIGGHGTLEMQSNKGSACTGSWKYSSKAHHEMTGWGDITCADGRKGRFKFTGDGATGAGEGYVGDEWVTFQFGA